MGFTPAVSSAKTPLFRALIKVSGEVLGAQVIPTVAGGFTDSHFFRDMGITSYGYSPFVFTISEFSGVHGNDERVSVKNMVEGVKTLHKVLLEFATDR
jgi:acetylornithine deacetylase/succinyl-diaminopimelate desuccinylase-like protein